MAGTHHIFLVRHGQVAGAAALYGKTDVALSLAGHSALTRQFERIRPVTRIVSSPLKRCLQFSQQVSRQDALPLSIEAGFRECDFGRWDGVPFDDIPADSWNELEAFWQAPSEYHFTDAEPLAVMEARVVAAWQLLLETVRNESEPQRIVVVTHGGVIRLILASVLGFHWSNPALYSQWQIGYGSATSITLAQMSGAKPTVNYVALPYDVNGSTTQARPL